jgi:hypothetical protein
VKGIRAIAGNAHLRRPLIDRGHFSWRAFISALTRCIDSSKEHQLTLGRGIARQARPIASDNLRPRPPAVTCQRLGNQEIEGPVCNQEYGRRW